LPQYTLRTDRQTDQQTDRSYGIGDLSVPTPTCALLIA